MDTTFSIATQMERRANRRHLYDFNLRGHSMLRSMLRSMLAIIFVLGLAMAESQGQGPAYYASKQASLLPLLQVLNNAGVSGSLEFSGTCNSFNGPDFPEFPRFDAPANNTDSPLKTLREMFAHNPTMQLTQDPDGTIRMRQWDVPNHILNVKIAHISFETGRRPGHSSIYNANIALARVFEAPEVKSFMRDNDIEGPSFSLYTGALSPSAPPSAAPHMSGAPLDNVTFSQALDYILKSFPGIWYYEYCPSTDKRNRIVGIGFYHLQRTGVGLIVQ
jgi:hypothetical protein